VSDFCSRWNLLVILLSFGGMLGCGGMQGTQFASTAVDLGQLSAAPANISFGNLVAGSSSVNKPLVLTNQGGSEITINQVSVSGPGYALSGPSVPLMLPNGQSASFTVTFTPPSSPPSGGTAAGNVAISSSAANAALSVSLLSTVVAPGSLTVNSDPVSFGTLQVGASQGQSVDITNSGGSSVVVSQVTVSGAGFTMTPMSMPMTLAPSQSANLTITFAPQSSGTASGSLAIVSNASDSALSVPLSGTAVAPAGLAISPSSFSFGSVQTGSSQSLPATLTNPGSSSVTVSQATFTGTGYSLSGLTLPLTLQGGQTVPFNLVFSPPSAAADNVSLTITSNASNPTLVTAVSGIGVAAGALVASPSSLSFGNVSVGSTQTLPEKLSNTGGSSVTLSQASFSGAGYNLSGLSLPLTLQSGQTASFNVVFSPLSVAADNVSLTISSNASNPSLVAAVSGAGVAAGALSASPTSLSFGNVPMGSSQTLQEELTNTGGASVTVSQTTFSGAGYSVSGLSLPLTLQSGQTASFNVIFSPQSAGADNLSLTIASNASNPSLATAVSGTGIATGALSASPTSLSFGNVQIGSSQTLAEKLSNTGSASVTLTQVAAGAAYSVSGLSLPMTLAAGASASFTVVFSPQSAGSSNASLAVTSSASSSAFGVPLSGAGVTPGTLSAAPLNFGSLQVGNSSTQTATLTDSGGSSLTVTQAKLTGAGFSMSGLSTPLTLTAGQSFTFTLSFAPLVSGAASGSISFVSNASDATLAMALSGTAVAAGQFAVSPSSFAFGSVTVGASKSLTATLTATGGAVTVTSAATSSTEFALSGPSLPLTIGSGGTASFTLTFTPQASGSATANLSFTTAGSSSSFTAALTGSGTAPVQHTVNLFWDASSSSLTGYNVYRGEQSGGPYTKINTTPVAGTTYTDSSVQAGQTYYYVTTSVGTDGMESGYSNQGTAVVPTP
jgi:hypothetical protein